MSKGEQKILNILQGARVKFYREYTFKDLKSLRHKPMRFDFVIYKNAEIFAVIEYDGQQHFHYDKHFSKSQQDFKYRQEADVRKNEYCLAHRIPLYRIPYYEYENINNYDDLFLSKFLVSSKWHNHVIAQRLSSGSIS